jgi:hypothetical protein
MDPGFRRGDIEMFMLLDDLGASASLRAKTFLPPR